jgi:hypothetical protein
MEIALDHLPFFDCNFEVERGAQSIDGASFQLRFNAQGVNRDATVHGSYDSIDIKASLIINFQLYCVRRVAPKGKM